MARAVRSGVIESDFSHEPPQGWSKLLPLRKSPFAKPITLHRVRSPGVCYSVHLEGKHVVERWRTPVDQSAFEGEEHADPSASVTTVMTLSWVKEDARSFVIGAPISAYDVDARGRREVVGVGEGGCGFPLVTVVGERDDAWEVVESNNPFVAYDPSIVELWWRSETSCLAAAPEPPLRVGCR